MPPPAAGFRVLHRLRTVRPISDELPFTTVTALAAPTTTEFPLAPGSGVRFDDPEHGPGQLAVIATPHPEGLRTTVVVALPDWSVGCHLTSGQLHRLTNGLAGRGRRNAIRPLSVDEDRHVHLTGTPERLTVEFGDRVVQIPAGPRRGLSKALRAFEQHPPLGAAS